MEKEKSAEALKSNQNMNDFNIVIPKVKRNLEEFCKSEEYMGFSDSSQAVVNEIFKTILASGELFCLKSGRTLGADSKTCENTALRVRRWLVKQGIVELILLQNGKRTNPKWAIVPVGTKNMPRLFQTGRESREKFDYINSSKINFMDIPFRILQEFKTHQFTDLEDSLARESMAEDIMDTDEEGIIQRSFTIKSIKREVKRAMGLEKSWIKGKEKADAYIREQVEFCDAGRAGTAREKRQRFIKACLVHLERRMEDPEFRLDFDGMDIFEKAYLMEKAGFKSALGCQKEIYHGRDRVTGMGFVGRLDHAYKAKMAQASNTWEQYGHACFVNVPALVERFRLNDELGVELSRQARVSRESKGAIKVCDDYFKLKEKNEIWDMIRQSWDKRLLFYDNCRQSVVWLAKDMICLDIEEKNDRLLTVISKAVPDAYITESPNGFHVFFHDPYKTMGGIKKMFGMMEVKRKKDHIVFSDEWDNYLRISGDIRKIGNAPPNFRALIYIGMGIPERNWDEYVDLIEYSAPTFNNSGKNVDNKRKLGYKLPEKILHGDRNFNMYRFARSLRARGFTLEIIEKCLDLASERCFDKEGKFKKPMRKCQLRAIMRTIAKRPDEFVRFIPLYSINQMPKELANAV